MGVVSLTHESHGDVEPIAGLAMQLPILGAEVQLCAPPDCAGLPSNVGAPLVPIGVSR